MDNKRVSAKFRGFTLLELMVVLAIAAILVTIATPSLALLLQSQTRSSAVNTFLADMRYARSEAIRRGGGVTLCRSDLPEATSPNCSTTTGNSGSGWASGWIVFHDLNADGLKDAADPLLRVQSPVAAIESILEGGAGTPGTPSTFRFTGTGRLFDLSSATKLTFGGSSYTADAQRVVCISFAGRARIAGDGASVCAD